MSDFASSVCFNMADLFSQDYEDAQNSDEGLGSGSEGMSGDADDDLCDDPSLEEICQGARLDILEEHQRSLNPYHRQAVVRTLQSSLRALGGVRQEAERLLVLATKLSRDEVEDIRCDLVEQVPHLAMVCHGTIDENGDPITSLVPKHLLPIVLTLLSDNNKLIHRSAQGALLALLEQGFLPPSVVEEKLVPVVVNWALIEDVELNTSSVGLMTKMAPIIGQELSIKHFLQPFSDLCGDSPLYVRKVCASIFGDLAASVGLQKTEEVLLDRFLTLCRDEEWAVRKACAEVFTSVSHAVSMTKRRSTLAVTFHNLLKDESRWVQVAAFQSLGSFIATFGDPGQYPNTYNHHVLLDTEGVELAYRAEANCDISSLKADKGKYDLARIDLTQLLGFSNEEEASQSADNLTQDDEEEEEDDGKVFNLVAELEKIEIDGLEKRLDLHGHFHGRFYEEFDEADENEFSNGSVFLNTQHHHNQMPPQEQPPPPPPPEEDDDIEEEPTVTATLHTSNEPDNNEEKEESFNTFQYWRVPVPELDLSDTLPPPPVQQPSQNDLWELLRPPISPLASLMPDHLPSSSPNLHLPPAPQRENLGPEGDVFPGENENIINLNQEIVPPVLISHFVSMATPTARTVDSEISHHCAYSLPAVVLTLGRENWPLLRETYQQLAGDMQWKVRRTMASSIHEIALILGQDLASSDLMPIFYGFVKDLDEVRIGILKHLTEFLKILRKEECDNFLPNLSKFLQMDHHSNWRYREELANQLIGVLDLCTPEQARTNVAPIALALLDDPVAAVREASLPLTAKVTRKLAEEAELLTRLIARFQELFVNTDRWMRRQCFALLCGHLMRPPQPALKPEIFCDRLLPMLAELAKDKVPNVRLAVAQSLSADIDPHPYFSRPPGVQLVQDTLKMLQNDEDRDVKYFSGVYLDQDLEISVLSPLSQDSSNAHYDQFSFSEEKQLL